MTYSYQGEPMIQELDSGFSETFMSVMRNVYLWMCLGLFVTAFVSMALIYTPLFYLLVQILQVRFLFFGLLIGEVAIVWWSAASPLGHPDWVSSYMRS